MFQRRGRRVAEFVRRLTAAESWEGYAAVIRECPPELSRPVEDVLVGWLRHYRETGGDDSEEVRNLEQVTWILNAYRTGRVTTGWPFDERYRGADHLSGPLETLVNSADRDEVLRAVAERPELLEPETDALLAGVQQELEAIFQHESAHRVARRRRMLAALRQAGEPPDGEFVTDDESQQEMIGLLLGARESIARFWGTGEDAVLDHVAGLVRRMTEHRMWHPLDREIRGSLLHAVATALQDRYEAHGDPADIETAVYLRRIYATQIPLDHTDRAGAVGNLGNALRLRFRESADRADLDAAVRELEDATVSLGRDAPYGALSLNNLGNALLDRYLIRGDGADLDRAVAAFTLATRAREDEGYPIYLNNLSRGVLHRYLRDGVANDLRLAQESAESALVLEADSPQRHYHLAHAAEVLRARFHQDRDMASLRRARALAAEALERVPQGPGTARHTLVLELVDADLAAVAAGAEPRPLRESLSGLSPRPPGRYDDLRDQVNSLVLRYGHLGDPADLDRMIAHLERAVRTVPADQPEHTGFLNSLGASLFDRFGRSGDPADLERAITSLERAARLAPGEASCLSNLGVSLLSRHLRTGDVADLDQAIEHLEEAVRLSPGEASYLSNLSEALRTRAEHTGEVADLDRAVDMAGRAVRTGSGGRAQKATHLANLGSAHQLRAERTGGGADLDEAITYLDQAARAVPDGHVGEVGIWSNLGNALRIRYERTGDAADLDRAVEAGRRAVRTAPRIHTDRAMALSNLANALQHRHLRHAVDTDGTPGPDHDEAADAGGPDEAAGPGDAGGPEEAPGRRDGGDLDEAIGHLYAAVRGLPAGHPFLAKCLSNLALTLEMRFERGRDPVDLDEALARLEEAVRVSPPGSVGRWNYLSNLGNALQARFEHAGDLADLEEAIRHFDGIVETTPPDHPNRAAYLVNLGSALSALSDEVGDESHLDRAVDAWRAAAELPSGVTGQRMRAALAWGRRARTPESAADGLAAAVRLLPRLAWHGLTPATRREHLTQWPGIARAAAEAAIAAGRTAEAVELLELGRSILWSQTLRLRTDLTALERAAPELAARLVEIRRVLDAPAEDEGVPRVVAEQRMRLAREWDDVVDRVRRLDGFAHFLRAVPYAELRRAAEGGPVVIVNVGTTRCDALIVTSGAELPLLVPLPGLHARDADHRTFTWLRALHRVESGDRSQAAVVNLRQTLTAVLAWLWDTIASPVLTALGEPSRAAPRLWWCPTGPLVLLPLHAAGTRDTDGASVPDQVVSSYTPTLDALIRARRGTPSADGRTPRLLAVGLSRTPGQPPLPAVPDELAEIARHHPITTRLADGDATRPRVLSALAAHEWAHLACHGTQNLLDPASAAVHLHDGPLTVADIAARTLAHAELVCLSACQAAVGGVALLDEAVHLAAALHVAGYRHVIATQWSIADDDAPRMASHLYATLTADGRPDAARAATALHHATRELRAAHRNRPDLWAPYLHIGP
ncbi:CHAT domain-containing protein [Sphaerisporangium aureirubrum]|uniref:CHAT domain-containing protein n=1 Tax=Sphaerisporangium aureirubrum TaxID=1544736 RepID=A0ABW1NDY0_9ACTN